MSDRLRQMFLIALQSTQDGEALSALRKAVAVAKAAGLDAHKLADRLTQAAPDVGNGISQQLMAMAHMLQQTRQENLRLASEIAILKKTNEILRSMHQQQPQPPRQSAQTAELDWRRKAMQLLTDDADGAHSLNAKELNFLRSILGRGWSTLTPGQASWLNDIWTKIYG